MINYSELVRSKFLSALNDYGMLSDADSVTVGFSGGADSVCLLHLFKNFEKELSVSVSAAHVDHGIRGAEANRDRLFCEDFCRNNGIEIYVKTVNCISLAENYGISLEECGRNERYAFFDSLCSEHGKIATAHNANDNAETLILNLCRGSALKGICGIPPVRGKIIRPLIFCTREEIEGYCKENMLDFVTDSTNLSDDYTRNCIRHNVLPVLENVNSAYLRKISEFCTYSSEISAYITEVARENLKKAAVGDGVYDAEHILSLNRAVAYECISCAYYDFADVSADRHKIESVYNLLVRKGRLQLSANVYAEVLKNRFRFYAYNDTVCKDGVCKKTLPLDVNGCCSVDFNDYRVSLGVYTDCLKKVNKNVLDNLIDCDKISGNVFLSTRSEGDKFTFYNRKVTKSLKKLFNEIGIPVEERDRLPVLYDDIGVVWVYGVGVNARCRVNSDSSDIIFIMGEK